MVDGFVRVAVIRAADRSDLPPADILGILRYQSINGEHYIDLTTTEELKRGDYVRVTSAVDGIEREYVVWSVEEPHEQDLIARRYRCVWSLQAILSTVTSATMPSNKTATQALTSLLSEQAAIQVGTVEPTTTGSASFWRMTAWEGLAELVKTWGGEVGYRYESGARYIDLLNRLGNDGAFTFVYGSSRIIKVVRKMPDGANYCRVIPVGSAQQTDSGGYGRKVDITSVNDGLPYLEDDEKASEFIGLPNPYPTAYIENSEITDPAELKAWAEGMLYSITRPMPEYEVELAEAWLDSADYIPALGDIGAILDNEFGVELTARITAIQVDELARTVQASCSTIDPKLGALAQLVSNTKIDANTGGTGTTAAAVLFTTTDHRYTSTITAYDKSTYGHNVFWRPGGNLIIGGGEWADTMRTNDTDQCYSGTGENLYLGADGAIKIYGAITIDGRNIVTSNSTARVQNDTYTGASNRAFYVNCLVSNSASPVDGKTANLYVMTDRLQFYTGTSTDEYNIFAKPSMLTDLGSTTAANPHDSAAPRPGVTGVLPIANGGTEAATKGGARTKLGLNRRNETTVSNVLTVSSGFRATNVTCLYTDEWAQLRTAIVTDNALTSGTNYSVATIKDTYKPYTGTAGGMYSGTNADVYVDGSAVIHVVPRANINANGTLYISIPMYFRA